jgi:hypothetical protein
MRARATGHLVKLNGAGAYQAAVHCATISAAKRMRGWGGRSRRHASGNGAASPPASPDPLPAALAEAISAIDTPATPPRQVRGLHPCWD